MKKSYLLLVISGLMISGCSNFFAKNKSNNQVVKDKPVKSIKQTQQIINPVFIDRPKIEPQPIKKPAKPVTANQSIKPIAKPAPVSKPEIAKKEVKKPITEKLVEEIKQPPKVESVTAAKPIAKPVLKKTETAKSNQKTNQPKKVEDKPVAKESGNKLSNKLKEQAKKAIEAGQYDRAVGFLENAQRLESKNVKLLFDIAKIKAHQKKWSEAQSYASRVIQIGGDKAILKKAWLLLSEVREKLGDEQGAKTAKQRASKIK